ncbi:MAG: hypothetical protein JXA24_04685 [Proteobacteria bacterium]|nr:hypothetical protein [Pseudomonadota bacterium]
MAPTIVKEAARLTPQERAFLKELTGNDYEAIVSGDALDGTIGLIGTPEVEILSLPDGAEKNLYRLAAVRLSREVIVRAVSELPIPDFICRGIRALLNSEAADWFSLHSAKLKSREDERSLIADEPLLKLFEKYDSKEMDYVEIVLDERDSTVTKTMRLEAFRRLYETLTPQLRSALHSIDLRERELDFSKYGLLNVQGNSYSDISHIHLRGYDAKGSGELTYHEAAHLLTDLHGEKLKAEWIEAAGDVYVGLSGGDPREKSLRAKVEPYLDKGLLSNDDLPHIDVDEWRTYSDLEWALTKKGLISLYATTSYDEDISELVGKIYKNDYTLRRMENSIPTFTKKIDLLKKYGYISSHQHDTIMGMLNGEIGKSLSDLPARYSEMLTAPAREVLGHMANLRSAEIYCDGKNDWAFHRGMFCSEFKHYDPLPDDVVREIPEKYISTKKL